MRDLFQASLYQTIALDPPWPEHGGGQVPRGADHHYDTVKTHDMARIVRSMGGWNPDPAGCSVWMWTTVTSLPDALALVDDLGARYVSHCVWVKAEDSTLGQLLSRLIHEVASVIRDKVFDAATALMLHVPHALIGGRRVVIPQHAGIGQHFRCAHELLLFASIGDARVPPTERRMPSVIFAPRPCHPGTRKPRHSAKPPEAYALIETHDLGGRRAELFARDPRVGWDVFGNEVARV